MTTFFSIQERHNDLYKKFIEKSPELSGDKYRNDLRLFLDVIVERSRNVEDLDEYVKLREIFERWRNASPVLGIVVEQILLPPDEFVKGQPIDELTWSYEKLAEWVDLKSNEIHRNKAIEWYQKMSVKEIVERYENEITGRAGQMAYENLLQAELYLASNVIEGKFHLVNDLTPDSYWRLEGKEEGRRWLSELKNLKAYFYWKNRGGGWGLSDKQNDYLKACDEILGLLLDRGRKAGPILFEPVRRYIERHYLNAEKKLTVEGNNGSKRASKWIKVKAERLTEVRVSHDSKYCKRMAKNFMVKFYENITRAVLGSDEPSTRQVLEALGLFEGFEDYQFMVNCFEMAIAIYFLDADLTRKLLNKT